MSDGIPCFSQSRTMFASLAKLTAKNAKSAKIEMSSGQARQFKEFFYTNLRKP
jgi:hypothetical protein